MTIDLPLAVDSWGKEEIEALHRVIDSGMFTMGARVSEYERQFAEFFGSRFAVMVSSGSAANLLMVAALFFTKQPRLQRGDEVIVPAVSWSTTYYPFHQYGLKLVFVDVDPLTLNVDPVKLAAAITDRTKAICLVNLLGNPNDFAEIDKIVGGRPILVLEDNCESMGASFNGRHAGTFGLMGTFSSFFSHHISTMEGGCIVTDDEEIYHILLSLRAHGWTRDLPKYNLVTGQKDDNRFLESFNFVLPGYNVRPLEMSGAVGQEQLKKLPSFIDGRRNNAECFQELFEDHPFLQIQHETGRSSWFGFAFTVKAGSGLARSAILDRLEHYRVESRPIVGGNFLKNKVVRYFDYAVIGNVDAADWLDLNGFFIGNHHVDIREKLRALRRVLS